MRTFGPGHPAPEPGAVPLDEVTGPVRATFTAFAEKLAAEGFAFLDARLREHGGIGPVLTCHSLALLPFTRPPPIRNRLHRSPGGIGGVRLAGATSPAAVIVNR